MSLAISQWPVGWPSYSNWMVYRNYLGISLQCVLITMSKLRTFGHIFCVISVEVIDRRMSISTHWHSFPKLSEYITVKLVIPKVMRQWHNMLSNDHVLHFIKLLCPSNDYTKYELVVTTQCCLYQEQPLIHYNINWKDVQRKSVVNNVDM